MKHLSFRCEAIDQLLGGGLEQGIITKVFGEAGTGKSNMVLQAVREAHRQCLRTVIIDSENVSTLRLQQLCANDAACDDIFKRLLVFHPRTFFEQERAIQLTAELSGIQLIVVDTMNLLYRVALTQDVEEAQRSYIRQMTALQLIARTKNSWVLIAEQVYTDQKGDIQPFTHKKTTAMVKTIVKLERHGTQGLRTARLLKHQKISSGRQVSFRLVSCGMQ